MSFITLWGLLHGESEFGKWQDHSTPSPATESSLSLLHSTPTHQHTHRETKTCGHKHTHTHRSVSNLWKRAELFLLSQFYSAIYYTYIIHIILYILYIYIYVYIYTYIYIYYWLFLYQYGFLKSIDAHVTKQTTFFAWAQYPVWMTC